MKEETKYIKHGQAERDYERFINFDRLRKERLERTQKAMEKYGLSAIAAHQAKSIRYITGMKFNQWSPEELENYTVVPVKGKPIQWQIGVDYQRMQEQAKYLGVEIRNAIPISFAAHSASEKVKKETMRTYTDNIKMVLKKNGLEGGKVGLDSWSPLLIEALEDADIEYGDATLALTEAKSIKTPDELEICRIGASIADACFYTMETNIRPGIRECELWAEMAKTAFTLGAENWYGLLNSGGRTNPYYRYEGSDKIISPGDLVISDITLSYMGYHTCVVRTFVEGGKPTSEQKALYRECYEYLYKAIDVCKAGVTSDKVADALPPHGWEGFSAQIVHGIGHSLHEFPFIMPMYKDKSFELEPGMYLALETYAGMPFGSRTQGVRLEENFVITENGYEVFSRYPFWDEKML